MLVVVIGVVAQKLNKCGKSPSVCVCFSEDPPGTFPSVFLFFIKITPLPLSYPRGDGDGDRFPHKIYIPPRGELRGYYGTRIAGP